MALPLRSRGQAAGRSRNPTGTGSIGVGADHFATVAAPQGAVGGEVDGLLEEVDRTVGEHEVGPAGVLALEALVRIVEPAAEGAAAEGRGQSALPARIRFELKLIGTVVPACWPVVSQNVMSAIW